MNSLHVKYFVISIFFKETIKTMKCPPSILRLPTSDSQLPTSDFRLPTSDFRLPSSAFRLPPSFLRLPTSAFRLPTSDFRLPTPDFRLPTSDFQLPTSDFQLPAPQPLSLPTILYTLSLLRTVRETGNVGPSPFTAISHGCSSFTNPETTAS